MRFIDKDKLKEVMGEKAFNSWRAKAKRHLIAIKKMNHKERSAYFGKNHDWTELYEHLSLLSNHKCWYSETPEGGNEFEIDHFRPKNRSKHSDGKVILKDGYWWLAYEETNFRIVGSLVNRRREDRFDRNEEILGKGDYFPLDLINGEACSPHEDLDCEVVFLLDPTEFLDTTLISFDKDGKIMPTSDKGTFEYERAQTSIEFLGLDHTPLKRERKKVWEKCEREIKKISTKINKSVKNQQLRQRVLKEGYSTIWELAKYDQPYSMVAVSCVVSNSIHYPWLKNIIPRLGN